MKDKKMSFMAMIILKTLAVFLYITYIVWMFWCQPFVACAAEKDDAVLGGPGNTVTAYTSSAKGNEKSIEQMTFTVKDSVEVIGYYSDGNIVFRVNNIEKKSLGYIWDSHLMDLTGYYAYYRNGEVATSRSYSMNNIPSFMIAYKASNPEWTVTYNVTGCKIFKDNESALAYCESGSLDGMVNVNVDMGVLDRNIGYLHDLTYEPLQYGETDENGIPESFDDCFTWSDFYPEYDDTYLVEVRASCAVETKKWFGLSKGTVYHSDIRNLANGISYKDLEFIISLEDERSVFADFINEHMPDESSLKSFGAVGAYQFDTYYFRIYKWDDELDSYRYGEWVRLTKDGTALMGSLDFNVDVGHFDKNDNWITNPETDYGEGKPGTGIVGSGNTQEDAKEDADQKKDEIDSGDNKIDLSDTNFMELWEWFCKSLISFWNGIGVIPEFFGRVFSFLPTPVYVFIGLGVVAAIILRILGR